MILGRTLTVSWRRLLLLLPVPLFASLPMSTLLPLLLPELLPALLAVHLPLLLPELLPALLAVLLPLLPSCPPRQPPPPWSRWTGCTTASSAPRGTAGT